MASVSIANNGTAMLCVLVEPLGEDFWIEPGQSLIFTSPDERPMVSWYENGTSLWVNEGDPYDVVVRTEAGEIVTCGFQRPPDAFAPAT